LAGLTQNHKKNIETLNQPIETHKISNKIMFSTSKKKRSQKIRMGATRLSTEFACSTQHYKKLSEHQINQSERKFSKKKYV
jgi:hypothetical protein